MLNHEIIPTESQTKIRLDVADSIFYVGQRFSNGAPQGLARCATLAFRKFTTCFLHYFLFSGIYKIGYDDHLEVARYPT